MAGSKKQRRLTRADQSDRTMTSVSRSGEHSAVQQGCSSRKANKQHKHSSKCSAYTIKYKIVIGIGPKIQSTPGPKHDQINMALIAHHLEVGTNWTLAESSAQFSLSSYVIVGRSNHLSTNEQFSWWDGENNTIYNLCSNHCFAYRGGMDCISLLGYDAGDLMTVNQRWTDEEPLGFWHGCQKTFSCVTFKINTHARSLQCVQGRTEIHSFTFLNFLPFPHPLSLSLSLSLSVLPQCWQSFGLETQFLSLWIDSNCRELTQLRR